MLALLCLLTAAAPHPLDPLSAPEIELAARVLRAYPEFPPDALFASLELLEPDKAASQPDRSPPRTALAVLFSHRAHRAFEAKVRLAEKRVTRWTALDGVQPMVLYPEYDQVTRAVRADARWQAAMKARGITDLTKVGIDGWAAGPAHPPARRVMRALSFYKGENQNYYNRPIEGVLAVVDLATSQVLEVIDRGPVPLAARGWDYDRASTGTRPQRPLEIAQPAGPDFQVNGHEVRWQGWRFRYSFHGREGLVLHQVGFERAGEKPRSILYRASLSEMIVPYGDPDPDWNWRAAFDVGEYGFGNLASPLAKGGDVPTNARLYDATLVDAAGRPRVLPSVVGIYERDGGVLWKHYDGVSGQNQVRRARQLVVASAATIGNYDYLLSWIFHQDGTLELDAVATGILLAKGTTQESEPAAFCPGCTGHLVDKYVIAPNHQHFFAFRLDFDVDGPANALSEMNQRAMPAGRLNPAGNGFLMEETELPTEAEARRELDAATNRHWRIASVAHRNALGARSGYLLVPAGNTPSYLQPGSAARRRAAFLEHALWATRYHPEEQFAAGAYPNQAETDRGLSQWSNGEPLSGEDLVVWYTMGLSHVPREEEWPIMNAHHLGFRLVPSGFFERNPALDVR